MPSFPRRQESCCGLDIGLFFKELLNTDQDSRLRGNDVGRGCFRRPFVCLMIFAGVVDGVFGDFDHQVFIGDDGLAAQARVASKPSLVEQVFFEFGRLFHAVEAFADNHVAGGAGAGFFAGVVDFDVVIEQNVEHGLAFGGVFDDCAFGTEDGVWQYGDFGHCCFLFNEGGLVCVWWFQTTLAAVF